jgi:hypothetical protein
LQYKEGGGDVAAGNGGDNDRDMGAPANPEASMTVQQLEIEACKKEEEDFAKLEATFMSELNITTPTN